RLFLFRLASEIQTFHIENLWSIPSRQCPFGPVEIHFHKTHLSHRSCVGFDEVHFRPLKCTSEEKKIRESAWPLSQYLSDCFCLFLCKKKNLRFQIWMTDGRPRRWAISK